MRKSICFCLSFLFIFMLAGCGEFVPPEPVKTFTAVADVLYNDMEIVCEISAGGKNNLLLSVTYPDNLRGFSYLWSDNAFRIGYRELYCENTILPLPDEAFAAQLGNFINGLYASDSFTYSSSDENGCRFTYNKAENVTFITDKNGNIMLIEFPNMRVELRDFSAKR